jgi:hypothetical protein
MLHEGARAQQPLISRENFGRDGNIAAAFFLGGNIPRQTNKIAGWSLSLLFVAPMEDSPLGCDAR